MRSVKFCHCGDCGHLLLSGVPSTHLELQHVCKNHLDWVKKLLNLLVTWPSWCAFDQVSRAVAQISRNYGYDKFLCEECSLLLHKRCQPLSPYDLLLVACHPSLLNTINYFWSGGSYWPSRPWIIFKALSSSLELCSPLLHSRQTWSIISKSIDYVSMDLSRG